jgi:hypothetical protein
MAHQRHTVSIGSMMKERAAASAQNEHNVTMKRVETVENHQESVRKVEIHHQTRMTTKYHADHSFLPTTKLVTNNWNIINWAQLMKIYVWKDSENCMYLQLLLL